MREQYRCQMSIASKNRKRKERLRRSYENAVRSKIVWLANQLIIAKSEARAAKENEAIMRKTLDEVVQRHLQVGIMKDENIGDQAVLARWSSPPLQVALPSKRVNPWEMSRDAIHDLGSFIRYIPGFKLTFSHILRELNICNRTNEMNYLQMVASHLGHSISRLVLQQMIKQVRPQQPQQPQQENVSAAANS